MQIISYSLLTITNYNDSNIVQIIGKSVEFYTSTLQFPLLNKFKIFSGNNLQLQINQCATLAF